MTIEDKIIQYFDGTLSDSESAEVLHRVSISPEIRQIFSEHEQLRAFAQRAVSESAIAPEVEEKLLAHISSLAENSRMPKAPIVFWNQTWFRVAAVVLIAAGVSVSAMYFSGRNAEQVGRTAQVATPPVNAQNSGVSGPAIPAVGGPKVQENSAAVPAPQASQENGTHRSYTSYETHTTYSPSPNEHQKLNIAQYETPSTNSVLSDLPAIVQPNPVLPEQGIVPPEPAPIAESDIASIQPVTLYRHLRSTPLAIGGDESANRTLGHIREPYPMEEPSAPMFEVGLQTSTGFSYPANGPSVHPFADFRGSIAYLITQQNLVGFRLSNGIFQLPSVSQTTSVGSSFTQSSLQSQRAISEELFYAHREMLSSASGLSIQGLVAGGLIPNGYTATVEMGFQIPLSSRLMTTIDFALTRVHSNAPLTSTLLEQQTPTSGDGVVIFAPSQGSDIRNTINGRVQYGLAFRF
jgi:anti-sigma factor RsiW